MRAGTDATETFQIAHGRTEPKKKHMIGRLPLEPGQVEEKPSFMKRMFGRGKKKEVMGVQGPVKDAGSSTILERSDTQKEDPLRIAEAVKEDHVEE